MPEPKLYELGAELEEVLATIIEREGEIDEETETLLDDLQLAFEEKAERVIMAIRAHKARAQMVKGEEERLAKLRRPHERTADSLKAYLEAQMRRADVRKVDRPLGKARIQKNSQATIELQGDREALAELFEQWPEFVIERRDYRLNRDAILAAHAGGKELPPQIVVETGEHLRVT